MFLISSANFHLKSFYKQKGDLPPPATEFRNFRKSIPFLLFVKNEPKFVGSIRYTVGDF